MLYDYDLEVRHHKLRLVSRQSPGCSTNCFQRATGLFASKIPEDMNVNENIVQEILHELFSSLESLETQSTAILQLLKEKGLATEQELAGPLE